VKFKLLQIVEAGDSIGAAEVAEEESMLLEALSSSIRQDLVFGARNYVLIKMHSSEIWFGSIVEQCGISATKQCCPRLLL